MREIKFRAWDTENNEFVYLALTPTYSGPSEYLLTDGIHPSHNKHSDDLRLEWQQFTGLKDKNGKEIYEGDVVRTDSGANMYVCYREDMQAFVVRFSETSGSTNLEKNWEVIGNIYENPELLPLTPTNNEATNN